MSFAWDRVKAKANFQKHKVSFEEAQGVFRDPLAVVIADPQHSGQEPREIVIGHSGQGRLMFVCFVEIANAEQAGTIRIISAREATRQERKKYEDNITF